MQVLLNSDHSIDGSQAMAEHLESVVKAALHRFGDHVTRVEAHLSAEHGDTHCTLEARPAGSPALVVKHHADNPHQAIDGAVKKLQRALGDEAAKHGSHADRTSLRELPPEAG